MLNSDSITSQSKTPSAIKQPSLSDGVLEVRRAWTPASGRTLKPFLISAWTARVRYLTRPDTHTHTHLMLAPPVLYQPHSSTFHFVSLSSECFNSAHHFWVFLKVYFCTKTDVNHWPQSLVERVNVIKLSRTCLGHHPKIKRKKYFCLFWFLLEDSKFLGPLRFYACHYFFIAVKTFSPKYCTAKINLNCIAIINADLNKFSAFTVIQILYFFKCFKKLPQ